MLALRLRSRSSILSSLYFPWSNLRTEQLASMAASADLPLYLLLLATIPIFLFFATRRSAAQGTRAARRLPPGPWALPVLGHLHHFVGRGKLPHHAMRDLARRHGPLILLRFGEVPVVVASSPAAAREVMRTHGAAFASRPLSPMSRLWFQGAGGISFTPHGDAWRQLRRICTQELLSARRVQSFRPVREDELRRLLRSVACSPGTMVNLTERISTFVADSTVRAIIGSRRLKDRDAYLRMLKGLFGIVPGMSLPDLFPSSRLAMLLSRAPARIRAYRRDLRRIMDGILQEHEDRRAAIAGGEDDDDEEDLVDVLLRLQKEVNSEFPLTTENIKSVMLDIFGAGSETSATALNWAMAELLRNPRAMKKAQDEVRHALAGHDTVTEDGLTDLHYLRLVIKETLRLHPPPLLLPRQCETPCRVLGFDVAAGTTVLVNAWAIGRDPAHWDAPDEFAPERFEGAAAAAGRDFRGTDFEFVPFGAGRRICPGIAFGVAHVELALAALLLHFDWALPAGTAPEELDMTEGAGLATRRRDDLLVVAATRVPVPAM